MKVLVKYLQADPKTGILRYRRVFPVELRQHIREDGRPVSELKVSLRSRRLNEPGAMQRYHEAAAEYDRLVGRAHKRLTSQYDLLDEPLIKYISDKYLYDELHLDEQARWGWTLPPATYESRHDREGDWEVSRVMVGAEDAKGLVEYWGDWTLKLARALGYELNPATSEFEKLCTAIGVAACKLWLRLDQRLDGVSLYNDEASTPDEPVKPPMLVTGEIPVRPLSVAASEPPFEHIVNLLMEGPRGDRIGGGVREHVGSFLRVLREVKGAPTPSEMTRLLVTEVLNMMALKPAKLRGAERTMDLPTLVKLYDGRDDVPRMSERTMDIRMSSMSTIWKKGVEDGLIQANLDNPFIGRKFSKTKKSQKRANGFTAAELKAYFSMPCFQRGERPVRGKGEAIYWIPLLSLFTGARPEEVAQLLVDDITQVGGVWTIRFTDKGIHPVKGPQTLKTEGHDSGERAFYLPRALIELGLLDYIAYLKGSGEQALFPLLRRKNKRPGIYDSFGNWFSGYVYDAGVLARDSGRQPVREFRHTWSTAARMCNIPREAMEYIQGHKGEGGEHMNDAYGHLEGHGRKIELFKVVDKSGEEVDIVALVPRWKQP